MTETLVGVNAAKKAVEHPPGEAQRAAVRELVIAARSRGESITGPDGLLRRSLPRCWSPRSRGR
jgi:hypothetical protein